MPMRRQPRQARSQERVNQILDVAERLFVRDGYSSTTTNAIAQEAKVSIGSLYQFFPDKSAIIYALAERYNAQLRLVLLELLNTDKEISLEGYVEQIIDQVYQFFIDNPGLYAIFMNFQGSLTRLEEIEETADNLLIEDFSIFLQRLYPNLEVEAYNSISFVLVKAIGNLLWISLGQPSDRQVQLLREIKRLALGYLQDSFG
ncbi:MAG: TetR/AcrR family transcriptional regulator [Pseudanabaenaceae cyanobacterium bins.68]|nr:TetR/AcrR family transcriptional regulator [Pseudanabaenaceae cyanobacterium bins.68]